MNYVNNNTWLEIKLYPRDTCFIDSNLLIEYRYNIVSMVIFWKVAYNGFRMCGLLFLAASVCLTVGPSGKIKINWLL